MLRRDELAAPCYFIEIPIRNPGRLLDERYEFRNASDVVFGGDIPIDRAVSQWLDEIQAVPDGALSH